MNDVHDIDAGADPATERCQARMQGMQQPERVDVPVQRAETAARHGRPDGRQALLQRGTIQHLERNTRTGVTELLEHGLPGAHFSVAEADPETAGLLERDVDAGELQQLLGQGGPVVDGLAAPSGVARKTIALALHPDQPEVSP
jgi:hypothetical protein